MASRIQDGELTADQLTLESISERYDVSLTPVRAAVSELIESGVLCRGENRRLAISSQPQSSPQRAAPPDRVDVYTLVSDHLVRLSLHGQAAFFLREESTAESFGVSRSQMRSIFARLAGEGLLEHIPRRGWKLRPFRRENLDAFNEIRVLLEVGALKLAKHRLVEEDLRRMLACNVVPTSADEPVQLDNSLHGYIIDKARNSYITEFFERQGKYYNLLSEWERLDREQAIKSVEYHRAILEALILRDWGDAETALVEHIFHSHEAISHISLKDLMNEPLAPMDLIAEGGVA